MVTLLKDVIVFCKRSVYSLGLGNLDIKGRGLGTKTTTVCFFTLF